MCIFPNFHFSNFLFFQISIFQDFQFSKFLYFKTSNLHCLKFLGGFVMVMLILLCLREWVCEWVCEFSIHRVAHATKNLHCHFRGVMTLWMSIHSQDILDNSFTLLTSLISSPFSSVKKTFFRKVSGVIIKVILSLALLEPFGTYQAWLS